MNPAVLGWMAAIAVAGMALGYEVFRLGAWLGLGIYALVLAAIVNPRVWWPR